MPDRSRLRIAAPPPRPPITITCPYHDAPLYAVEDRAYRCPTCRWDFVVSITPARYSGAWNTDAPGAGAVLAVMEATG